MMQSKSPSTQSAVTFHWVRFSFVRVTGTPTEDAAEQHRAGAVFILAVLVRLQMYSTRVWGSNQNAQSPTHVEKSTDIQHTKTPPPNATTTSTTKSTHKHNNNYQLASGSKVARNSAATLFVQNLVHGWRRQWFGTTMDTEPVVLAASLELWNEAHEAPHVGPQVMDFERRDEVAKWTNNADVGLNRRLVNCVANCNPNMFGKFLKFVPRTFRW